MSTTTLTGEEERLKELARFAVLDSLPEEVFEKLARLTARHFKTPLASISFLDERRQWIKAGFGLSGRASLERCDALVNVGFAEGRVVSTPDLQADARFAPYACTGGSGLRFYASAPLLTSGGQQIGSLCIAAPGARRALDAEECRDLAELAGLVMNALDLRLQTLTSERESQARDIFTRDLKDALTVSQTIQAVTELADLELEPGELLLRSVELASAALGVDWGGLAAIRDGQGHHVSAWHRANHHASAAAFAQTAQRPMTPAQGGLLWRAAARTGSLVFVDDYAQQPDHHPEMLAAGARSVASASLGRHGGTGYVMTLVRLRQQTWSSFDRELVSAVARAVRQTLERSAMRANLRGVQERLRLTLDSAPLVMWATDMNGVFTVSEGRGLSDLGVPAGAAVGRHVAEIYVQAPQIIENVRRTLAGETFITAVEVGGRIYEASYSPLLDNEGRQIGAMGVGYDVTARVRTEREIRRAHTQAEALVELSQVLELDADDAAQAALVAIERALEDSCLVLWQWDDDTFLPLARAGHLPFSAWDRHGQDVPVSRTHVRRALEGQRLFLNPSDLSAEVVQRGLRGAALLPVLLHPGRELVLGIYRAGAFEGWSALDQALLGAAERSLSAWATRRHQRQELQLAASTDALTGLGNRRAFEAELEAAVRLADATGEPLGLLSIDLDGLKGLNDLYGHAQGDELLRAFGRAMKRQFLTSDHSYRLGGDEYAILLPGVHPGLADELLSKVQRIAHELRQGGFPGVGASAGLACYPADVSSAEALTHLSDVRMYSDKASKPRIRAV
ncbi:diguanylate cyclase domain-containing protein [Deinococcus sp.]|uniref:diguanylate cyclase domain-containing protein n=1 Tax=Deinococcus sp. TaxID=47478 RepID=UPI003CC662E2